MDTLQTRSQGEQAADKPADDALKKNICPCCGQPTLDAPPKPGDEVMDQYLACMITGTPFSHTYQLFNGRISVTVTQLRQEQIDRVNLLCSQISELESACGDSMRLDKGAADGVRTNVRMLVCVDAISVKASSGSREYRPSSVVMDVADKVDTAMKLQDMQERAAAARSALDLLDDSSLVSSIPGRTLLSVVATHNRVSDLLMEAGFDENFWKGIELA